MRLTKRTSFRTFMTKPQKTLRHKFLPIHVFDFFSGCGGTCKGFQDAGMVIVGAIDNDTYSQMTFRHNFADTFLNTCSIEDLAVVDLQQLITRSEGHPILFSVSAPCQPFKTEQYPTNLTIYVEIILFKLLVTIKQTLGCLISCTYEWPSGEEAVIIVPVISPRPSHN